MTSYFQRYIQGAYQEVWQELYLLGNHIQDARYRADGQAVAHETMRRVRLNIDRLCEHLEAVGYVFGYAWARDRIEQDRFLNELANTLYGSAGSEWGEAFSLQARVEREPPVRFPPTISTAALIQRLENERGVLPLSLKTWFEHVGGVNFMGKCPSRWRESEVDSSWQDKPKLYDYMSPYPPLTWIPPEQDYFQLGLMDSSLTRAQRYTKLRSYLLRHWPHTADPLYIYDVSRILDQPADRTHEGDFTILLSPDEFAKYFMSGGAPYSMILPNATADFALIGEWHETTFVEYLRECCRWGGLPGIETWHIPEDDLKYLRNGLIPFY